jgi:hypothetical protein
MLIQSGKYMEIKSSKSILENTYVLKVNFDLGCIVATCGLKVNDARFQLIYIFNRKIMEKYQNEYALSRWKYGFSKKLKPNCGRTIPYEN